MALVGGVLNANTVLQPQFMQELLGYTATTAGMALTAGGIALLIVMPLAGFATGKISARTLAVCGFILFTFTFRYAAAVTSLTMTFNQASVLRVIQMLPLPFCFISITTAAYVGLPKEESNQVSGLINFSRNIGGSILIALTNAQVTSRGLWHQQHLQSFMGPGNPGYQQHMNALTGLFGGGNGNGSFGGADGASKAMATIYNQLNMQARMQGYQDVYIELSWMSVILVLLAFLLSSNRPGQGPKVEGAH
jgi:DHA2 family multidrug resistance protein